jgi:hypothetical protein
MGISMLGTTVLGMAIMGILVLGAAALAAIVLPTKRLMQHCCGGRLSCQKTIR